MTDKVSTRPTGSQLKLPNGKKLDKGQVIKWTVYILLLLNFFFYFFEEWYIASNTLAADAGIMDWTREFATSIDELGWFGLLFAFELETYALSDKTLERPAVVWSIHGVRLICYIMLAHTVLARVSTLTSFEAVTQATEVTNLCQVADQGIVFDRNYVYTEVDADNCSELSTDDTFFYIEPNVIADSSAYELERKLVWVDMNDAVVWLLVVWAIELTVWLQNREITGGRLMLATHAAKVFYAVLFLHAAYWVYTGHPVWAWDQFLWIAGFWAIERNLSEWREEIREEEELDAAPVT